MDVGTGEEGEMAETLIEAGALTITSIPGDVHKVRLEGELDIASAPRLEEELSRIRDSGPARVVIDLSRLEFLDSTGIRVLLMADEQARSAGVRLGFLRGSEAVTRTLEMTGLDGRLSFID